MDLFYRHVIQFRVAQRCFTIHTDKEDSFKVTQVKLPDEHEVFHLFIRISSGRSHTWTEAAATYVTNSCNISGRFLKFLCFPTCKRKRHWQPVCVCVCVCVCLSLCVSVCVCVDVMINTFNSVQILFQSENFTFETFMVAANTCSHVWCPGSALITYVSMEIWKCDEWNILSLQVDVVVAVGLKEHAATLTQGDTDVQKEQ